MIELGERQEIIKLKIDNLLKIIGKNRLTNCSNDIKLLVHEVKGLCGLFNYLDLFNLFYEMERTLNLNDFESFKKMSAELQHYDLSSIETNIATISYRKSFKYELYFCFVSIKQLNKIIQIISDCVIIVHSKLDNNKICLDVYSYCDNKSMELLCKTYMISVKQVEKFSKNSDDFMGGLIRTNDHFNNKYLHLFFLESITNFARIAKKTFNLNFESNEFILSNAFLNNYYIVFAELIKNVFSHSGKKNVEKLNIKCLKRKNHLFIKIYNEGNRIDRKNRKYIFEKNYTTSDHNYLSGQGMGLYDVKNILLNYKGSISFKNKLKGVMFIVKAVI